ncbi:MAG: efflux RND transporter periplasmic adaptor subunit, partial [Opitutales bacterium]
VGNLAVDETRRRTLSARFPARLEELFVNYTGIRVERGQHLAVVYSPELLSAQRELISAHQRDPDGAITAAAREKLRLWDLPPEQIDAILERGTASDRVELRAPLGGVVLEAYVQEGDYVQTGEPLFRIADLSELWLHLQAYESDLPFLRYGQAVEFSVEAFPGKTFTGQVAFLEPALDRRTRTLGVRVNVPNTDLQLRPGMFARASVKAQLAAGGEVVAPELAGKWISPMHPEIVKEGPGACDVCGMPLVPAEELGLVGTSDPAAEAPLVVPSSAVLRTGQRAVVYVELPDTERPTYEGREIVLGPRAGNHFVVLEGLEAGDAVVTHGAFKIDSALQIQAKPSMMSASEGEDAPATPELEIPLETAEAILPAYLELQDALASDALDAARTALQDMMAITGHHGPLPDLVHQMLAGEDLDALRRPHFETLSHALIETVDAHPDAFDRTLYRMHCPMVYPDRGADWIQADDQLRNPYFGAMMLKCGEVSETWNEGAE